MTDPFGRINRVGIPVLPSKVDRCGRAWRESFSSRRRVIEFSSNGSAHGPFFSRLYVTVITSHRTCPPQQNAYTVLAEPILSISNSTRTFPSIRSWTVIRNHHLVQPAELAARRARIDAIHLVLDAWERR